MLPPSSAQGVRQGRPRGLREGDGAAGGRGHPEDRAAGRGGGSGGGGGTRGRRRSKGGGGLVFLWLTHSSLSLEEEEEEEEHLDLPLLSGHSTACPTKKPLKFEILFLRILQVKAA